MSDFKERYGDTYGTVWNVHKTYHDNDLTDDESCRVLLDKIHGEIRKHESTSPFLSALFAAVINELQRAKGSAAT